MRRTLCWTVAAYVCWIAAFTGTADAMLKTMTIKKEPAIVVAAFGTTTRARATYDFFEEQLRKKLPAKYRGLRVEWAFTSEIVRERANKKFARAGLKKRYKSVAQVISDLENEGYRKIVVQPLHIFPGIEYESLLKMVEGLRMAFQDFNLEIEVGTPLLLHWEGMEKVLESVAKDFLPPEKGCNVLVAHGTGETDNQANITYLGLDRLLKLHYTNVVVGSVEGIVTRDYALETAKKCPGKRIRFIPFMYVAGDHIMNDIMGQEPGDDGELSWALEMKKAGFEVESTQVTYKGERYFKGLGFIPEIDDMFIESIVRSLKKLEK